MANISSEQIINYIKEIESELSTLEQENSYLWEVTKSAKKLLDKIDTMTTEEFSRGGEKEEREDLRDLLKNLEQYK